MVIVPSPSAGRNRRHGTASSPFPVLPAPPDLQTPPEQVTSPPAPSMPYFSCISSTSGGAVLHSARPRVLTVSVAGSELPTRRSACSRPPRLAPSTSSPDHRRSRACSRLCFGREELVRHR
ncbi:hypothetical protein VPH35_022612 [Triticum aestivum]